VAVRRPDGYVGKPPELGTDVFAMDTGYTAGSHRPSFDSGFPVDFGFTRMPASSSHSLAGSRLTGKNGIKLNQASTESGAGNMIWDEMAGFWDYSSGSSEQAWMWKRHAGFDVVAYGPGNEVEGRPIPHSLNKIPEMIWLKNRDSSDHWIAYHKDLNGGTNPEQYYLWLETTNAEDSTSVYWNSTAPTSTHFTVGNGNAVNQNNKNYIAMLFASVDGISKVGSYTGNGTSGSSTQTITTGFQPRFIIIKRTDTSNAYTGPIVLDTTRGWGSGDDEGLFLNSINAQSAYQYGTPTSTGFTLAEDHTATNSNNGTYIYYAHA